MQKCVIGLTYKDRITGFVGLCTGLTYYISGCNQALLSPKVKADGSLNDSNWFDVQRLEETGADKVTLDNGATPGCDKLAPVR